MIDCIILDCDEDAVVDSNYCAQHREEVLRPRKPPTGKDIMADILGWFK